MRQPLDREEAAMLRIEELKSTDDPAVHFVRPGEIDGLLAAELNGREIEDRGQLLDALGRTLDFPHYYGANWDAFEECLYDRGCRDREGCVLVIRGGEALWERLPGELGLLVAIWFDTATRLRQERVPLHLILVVGPG